MAKRAGITARRYDVLLLLAEGLTNEEIGAVLYIGTETVKTHVIEIRRALRAKTRAHAVAEAFRRDLLL